MTSEVWLLVGWILVGAAFLVAHLVTLWSCLRAGNIPPLVRALALLPPATPLVAWRVGKRTLPIVWAVLLAVYIGLRLSFRP